MEFTLGYVTGRADPRFDWVIDSLAHQAHADDQIHLIIVDALGRTAEDIGWYPHPMFHEDSISMRPKPTPWQGPHRITSKDCWAMSNARNTVFVYAPTDYVAIIDDRCRLGPNWLDTVRHYYERRATATAAVVCGAYEKHEDGKVTKDNRLAHAPSGHRNCGGNWLYGCTFALPLEWALAVNGFEEGCDGMSFEDVIFGLHLFNAGYSIDYMPSMFVEQHRGAAQANTFFRTDKGISPKDKSHAALDRFGKRKRTEFTPDLRKLRELAAAGGEMPLPDYNAVDWYDGTYIRDV